MHLPRTDRSPYAPATLAADISRIVDPTYSFSRLSPSTAPASSTSSQFQPRVYVDHAGDMHDPDYRDFPALPSRGSRRPSSAGLQPHNYTWPAREHSYDSRLEDQDATSFLWTRQTASPSTLTSSARSRAESSASMDGYFGFTPSQTYTSSPSNRWSSFDSPRFDDIEPRNDQATPSPPAIRTNGHGLRYQFNAMSLNLRLKVVRVKRRWRDRHQSHAQV